MLYSQGVPLEELGVPRADGGPVESDPRTIWRRFADHYPLFRGTPSRMWRSEEHTSELQSLMRISYAVFCLKKKKIKQRKSTRRHTQHKSTMYQTNNTIRH